MSSRGNNYRGKFRGRNFWRGGYRGRFFRNKKISNRNISISNNNTEFSDDTLDQFIENDSDQTNSLSKVIVLDHKNYAQSPYSGWKFYFPNENYKTSSEIIRKIKIVEKFISNHNNLFDLHDIEDRRACVFDIKILSQDDDFKNNWTSFQEDLLNDPEITLNCLGLAIHQVLWQSNRNEKILITEDEELLKIEIPVIKTRITNYDVTTNLKNLRTIFCGKLVSVSGTVIKVNSPKLHCSFMAFQCFACSAIQVIKQTENKFIQPTHCLNKHCRYKKFNSLRSSQYTLTYDWQSIKIQELITNDTREGGRLPRTVECDLSDDLVCSCAPGDVITIIGIVKFRNCEKNFKRKGPSLFTLYLDAVSIINNKSMDQTCNSSKNEELTTHFTQKDFHNIQEIYNSENIFKLMVNSICPTIYGHEMVKAGLVLALFGGSDSNSIETRGQIHVLVVGDPGLGKSQMLRACSFITTRGVYVCGSSTTTSGLTVTLSRESGECALEAGALVLADQGCCCIDEFDKMPTQHKALLEVMEQQTVSIAKAGVICTLPARTSVLAAANPTGGHYNKNKTVSENLRMGQALLSRFDLVFILLDKPNEQLDNLLSKHIMKMHSVTKMDIDSQHTSQSILDNLLSNLDISLNERLKVKPNEQFSPIPPHVLRNYIAYSRKYVPRPTLSQEAKNALQQFYLQMREHHHTLDSTPVTTRQLLSLIRLTQARAKLELRLEATLTDALEVIELVKWSFIDTFSDESGTLHFQRSQHGSGMSSRKKAKKFLSILHRKSELVGRSTFSLPEMKDTAKSVGITTENFEDFISTLNTQGFLLSKGKNTYQILSVE